MRFSVRRSFSALTVSILLAGSAHALAPRPVGGDYAIADQNVFRRDEVTICEITIDPADLQFLYDNPETEEKKNCTMRWKNSVIDETVTDVGIRSRGNLSRGAPRRSWKIDFNEFVPGRAYQTLEEMDLNGDYNDPTLLRRMMAHEFHFRMGLATSRTHYVAIYFNGVFTSLNIHVEAIDEEFADSWFGNKDGNLYKCVYKGEPADLVYRSAEDYQLMGNGETYRETNNDPLSDYTDLKQFIAFLNQSPDASVYTEGSGRINVDGVLRYLATNVAVGSWDDYWYGSNNYYLYRNQNANLFELIPYDYDNSFGIDFFDTNWSTRHFDNWGDGGYGTSPAPLVAELFNHSEWRRQYRRYLAQAATVLEDPTFQARAAQWHNLIQPWFDGTIESGGTTGTITSSNQHDPYFMQYDQPATFNRNLNAHCHGIVPFIQQRAAALRTQLAEFSATPALPRVRINEVVASNATINVDNFGEPADWIELYNAEATDVDLSGWHLSDNPSAPLLYSFPAGTTIPAGGYLLVWADNQIVQQDAANPHTPFSLSAGGETVTLWHNVESGTVLVDSLTYGPLATDRSFGRFPDGGDTTQIFETVTPLAPNDDTPIGGGGEPRTPPRVYINEYMAQNTATIQDNFGEFADWVELYNDEDVEVSLAGMHLTDDLLNPTKWEFPAGVTIAPKGFLLVWTDNNVIENAPGFLHTNFGLSAAGEGLGLFDDDVNQNQPVHTLTFARQTANISEGLLPDGVGTPAPLARPTPGVTNVLPPVSGQLWMIQ